MDNQDNSDVSLESFIAAETLYNILQQTPASDSTKFSAIKFLFAMVLTHKSVAQRIFEIDSFVEELSALRLDLEHFPLLDGQRTH